MFLLKPHVTGREGQVTSPDVIVDAVLVDGEQRPTVCVTHECWQQAARDIDLRPAYCIMALGGGALILPGVTLSTGLVIVSRQAWRLAHVDDHIDQITLNDMSTGKSWHAQKSDRIGRWHRGCAAAWIPSGQDSRGE